MENKTLEPKLLARSDQLQGPERQRVDQMRAEFNRRLAARGFIEVDKPEWSAAVDVLLEMLVRRRAL